MDRFSSPAFHKVASGQFKFLRFVGFLIVLFLISFIVTVPSTYPGTAKPAVSQLQNPPIPIQKVIESSTVAHPNETTQEKTEPDNRNKTEQSQAQVGLQTEGPESFSLVDEIRLEERENPIFENLSMCQTQSWNNVTIDQIPLESIHRQWIENKMFETQINDNSTSPIQLLAAFAHPDQITVTLASETALNTSVFCRYYDCKRREMVRQKPSFVFPASIVYCPRRAGAQFISLTESLEERASYSVPIVPHLSLSHFFTVCVSVDLNTTSHLEIAEFIEYYKLQGASFFHVYLKNSRNRNRAILDDYVRTGDVEVIVVPDYSDEQKNDCHHHNKYFSKWAALLQLEDRLQMVRKHSTVSDHLDSITDPNTNIIRWASNETSRVIIRPERMVSMSREPIVVYMGATNATKMHESIGLIRTVSRSNPSNQDTFAGNIPNDSPFRKELIHNTLERIRWVYNTVDVNCQKKQEARLRFGRNSTCLNDAK